MKKAKSSAPEPEALPEALNDYVLVKLIEMPVSDTIIESEHWKQNPNWAEVVSVGEGRVINGLLLPIDLVSGDKVYITKYFETVELEQGKFALVHASECKLRKKRIADA
jgi:co-chaperonin GroES (HSP10)